MVIVLRRQQGTESSKSDMNTSGYHLGINMGHDRSVAVVQDGKVIVAIEQERLDRIKAGCIKDYGDRHHTSDEMLAVIKKYKLTEKQWRRRMKKRDS